MLDKIQHTTIVRVPVCLPGQWWTLGGTPHTELSVPSFRREGGHEDGVMKESMWSEEWNRQLWLDSSLRDADNRKGERGLWNSSPSIKNKKTNNCQTNSGPLYIESIFYATCYLMSSKHHWYRPSSLFVYPSGGMFHLAVPVFCLMGG